MRAGKTTVTTRRSPGGVHSPAAVAAVSGRDRLLISACVVLITTLAWAYLMHLARQMSSSMAYDAMMAKKGMAPEKPWTAAVQARGGQPVAHRVDRRRHRVERTVGGVLPGEPDAGHEHGVAQRRLDGRALHQGAQNREAPGDGARHPATDAVAYVWAAERRRPQGDLGVLGRHSPRQQSRARSDPSAGSAPEVIRFGELLDLLSDRPARRDQVRDEPFGHFNRAFVLGAVSQIVALRKNAPVVEAAIGILKRDVLGK